MNGSVVLGYSGEVPSGVPRGADLTDVDVSTNINAHSAIASVRRKSNLKGLGSAPMITTSK